MLVHPTSKFDNRPANNQRIDFEGTVNQYIGDGIMAQFGTPIAPEDDAPRAWRSVDHRPRRSLSTFLP